MWLIIKDYSIGCFVALRVVLSYSIQYTKYEQRNRKICWNGIWVTRDEQQRSSNCFESESVPAPGAVRCFLLQNLTVQPFLWPQITRTIGHRCLTLLGVFASWLLFVPSDDFNFLQCRVCFWDGRHLLLEHVQGWTKTNYCKFQQITPVW